jgi:hypothetical protein
VAAKDLKIPLKPKDPDEWVKEKPKTNEPTIRLTVDLPRDLHRKLRFRAFDESIPMAELVRKWIEEKLA